MPMVTVATLPELDAAEALLELQGEMRELQPERSNSSAQEEIESSATAALYLNSLFLKRKANLKTTLPGPSLQTTSPSTSYFKNNFQLNKRMNYHGVSSIKRSREFTIRRQVNVIKQLELPCKKRLIQESQLVKRQQACWSEVIPKSRLDDIKERCDRSTQTEVEYQLPQIDKMESIIEDLRAKFETLENKLKMKSSVSSYPSKERNNLKSNSCHLNSSDSSDENVAISRTSSSKHKRYPTCADSDWKSSTHKISNEIIENPEINNKTDQKRKNGTNANVDLIPIGDGHAFVPSRLLKNMDWSTHTNATRKLLRAVFPRSVLATHSLTGKPSPAFPNKPAKKQLDPALVNDIVQTVVDNCRVSESVVRTSITTKCADESKMFRNLLRKNKSSSAKINQENIPPLVSKLEESEGSYLST